MEVELDRVYVTVLSGYRQWLYIFIFSSALLPEGHLGIAAHSCVVGDNAGRCWALAIRPLALSFP